MWAAGAALTCLPSLQGWYIVTYALGIYHLNLFIAFLSPKVDPSLMEDSGSCWPGESGDLYLMGLLVFSRNI